MLPSAKNARFLETGFPIRMYECELARSNTKYDALSRLNIWRSDKPAWRTSLRLQTCLFPETPCRRYRRMPFLLLTNPYFDKPGRY